MFSIRSYSKIILVLMAVFSIFILLLPIKTHSQTTEELQIQINDLNTQVQALLKQIGVLNVGTTSLPSGGYEFTRNLALGSKGNDVYELQKVLNKDIKTQVAVIGPGSPGSETEFFGNLTHNAVIRYQEIYKNEILTPVDLSRGTGFVGPSTRKKLNSMYDMQEIVQAINSPVITSVSPDSGKNGTEIVITGNGFTENDNIIRTTFEIYPNESSSDGKTLTFIINSTTPVGLSESDTDDPELAELLNEFNTLSSQNPIGSDVAVEIDEDSIDSFYQGNELNTQQIAPIVIYVSNENGISNTVLFNLVF